MRSHEQGYRIHFSLDDFRGSGTKGTWGVEKIKEECKKWADGGCICDNTFSYELNYFRKRYINCESRSKNNDFKELFGDHLGTAYCRDTEEFLLGKRHSPEINALTVLYVVYRYRNNLFHGPKWIRNEYYHNFEVFTYANCILMKALRFHQLTSSADG